MITRIALAVVALAAAVQAVGQRATPVPAPPGRPVAAATMSNELQRGEYLARAGNCVGCHTTRGGAQFAGGLEMATPFGKLYTPNITPDVDAGIGRWSADDFWQALHFGRMPGGQPYYPAFPYDNYTRVSRADADAIFAYLRSIPSVRAYNRPHELRFPFNQRLLLNVWRALYFEPGEFSSAPGRNPEWNRGAYLVQGLGHCDACHTGRNLLGAPRRDEPYAGGMMPVQHWYAPALGADRAPGPGAWEIDDLAAYLRSGVSRRSAASGPMAQVVYDSLQYLTHADVRAIAVYLKSLPARAASSAAQVRTTPTQARDLYALGARLYGRWCVDCHRDDGAGLPPAYPPLANNRSVSEDPVANLVRVVMFGGFPPATAENPRPFGMPPFAQAMSDEEIAAVATFVRQSWGNGAAAVAPAEVGRYRFLPLD